MCFWDYVHSVHIENLCELISIQHLPAITHESWYVDTYTKCHFVRLHYRRRTARRGYYSHQCYVHCLLNYLLFVTRKARNALSFCFHSETRCVIQIIYIFNFSVPNALGIMVFIVFAMKWWITRKALHCGYKNTILWLPVKNEWLSTISVSAIDLKRKRFEPDIQPLVFSQRKLSISAEAIAIYEDAFDEFSSGNKLPLYDGYTSQRKYA